MSKRSAIENIYPLAPLQEGMLFHSLYAPESGVYVGQFGFVLEGPLDAGALERAWQGAVARHEALRAAFAWEGVPQPMQVIRREVRVPFRVEDWRELDEAGQRARLEAYLADDRAQGFDLKRPPLMRLALFRVGEEEHHLVWTHHHLILDGWSVSLLFRDVLGFYAAYAQGAAPQVGAGRRYRDYVSWLAKQDRGRAEAFWRGALAGFDTPTPLPGVRARAGEAHGNGTAKLALSRERTQALQEQARRWGVTPSTLVQGAWALLLSRWSGEEDVVFGATVSGRPPELPGAEETVGLFINTLPVRVRLEPEAPLGEWLVRLQREQVGAREYQYAPLAQVQKWSEVPAGEGLFDSLVVFENYPIDQAVREHGSRLGELRVRTTPGIEQANYPLVVVAHSDVELRAEIRYDRGRVDDDVAERLAGHLETLLEAMAADPQRRLSDLSLLRDAEREQLLAASRAVPAEHGRSTVHELFARQAERTPGAAAVSFGDESLAYAELERRANRLAHHLRRRGVGPEARVGVCAERSAELVVALLAVLKAGGAYVPIDPAYPAERIAYLLEDSGCAAVLVQGHLRGLLGESPVEALVLEDALAETSGAETAPEVEVDPRNAAYVIYTSGSTGRPKGVVVTHGNVSRLFAATDAWFGFGESDVWTLFHSYAFDFSVWEIWGALLYGGRLVVVPWQTSRDPEAFHALLAREGVTVLNQTPSAFRQLASVEEGAGASADLALRYVIFGGEALEPGSLRGWMQRHGEEAPRLVNMYGITETTVHVTYRPVRWADVEAGERSPVGEAIPDLAVRVLDRWGSPVPVGVPGELYVGGAGVARGYLGRPELTAERFVPDPFGGEAGARLYRSGDRARWLAEGELEYLGRTDAQVKIRGFRIEPGEIEGALVGLPGVREAVVVVREDAPGQKRLVAYVVPEAGAELAAAELRDALSARLPEHMVPSALVPLERLPLTANGKIDRRALPAPEAPAAAGEAFVAPRTEVEAALAAVWSEVLGVERIGVESGFFELGGDSILSIQVVSRARQRGLNLTPRQLFERPTIARLAEVVERTGPAAAAQAQEPVTGEAPLTPIQHRFFEHPFPARHHFNQALLLVPREPLKPGLLARAAGVLEAHHDALRLRFARGEGGAWRQWHVEVGRRSPLAVFDLSGLPEEARRSAVEAAAEQVQRSLELERGPLLRMAYFDLGAGRAGRLLAAIHHLAVDGVSWRILLEDLETAYGQLSRGEAARLPAKTTSWKAWAERLAQHARSEALAREAAYWTAQTRHPVAALPTDDPGAENTASGSRVVSVSLSEEETGALLREVPQAYRTQVDAVLLTALAGALRRWTGERRLRVDLEGHGREEEAVGGADLSRTVGWFTTVYPVVLELPEAAEAGAALKAVKEQLRAVPGKGIGYGLLRYLAGGEAAAELGRASDPEVAFNYLGQLDASVSGKSFFAFAEESAGASADGRSPRQHLLEVVGSVRGGRLELQVGYAEGVHRRETAERLAEGFAGELRELIADCRGGQAGGYTPSDFPLAGLAQAQLDALLGSGRGVEDVYPLTPMQEGMLFHTLDEEGLGTYVGQMVVSLSGAVDAGAFARAWQGAVDRHAALRTRFVWEGLERPLQVVAARAALEIAQQDWREHGEARQQALLAEYLDGDRRRGVDVSRAPLMRLAFFRTGEERYELVWTHHHLVLDGWSLPVLFRDVLALYEGHAYGRPVRLGSPRPHRDYVAWLAEQDFARAEEAWRGALAGFAAPTPLPLDGAARGSADAGPGRSGHGEARLRLDGERTARLQAFARAQGLTVNTLVQAAWGLLLARWSGEADVVFGATASGRPPQLPGVEEMVGLFINTLPVRIRVRPEAPVGEWLAETQARQAALRQHEHTPLVQLQRWSEVPAGQPLFESVFAFANYPVDPTLGDRDVGFRVESSRMIERDDYPLFLAAAMRGEALGAELVYHRSRYPDGTAELLLEQLGTLLDQLAADPRRRVEEVTGLTAAERERILAAGRGAAAEYPGDRCVHELISQRAAAAPDAVAVVAGGARLSFGELEERAGRLAARLRALGVGPEARVAILLDKSIDLGVAILGVLKAGGAYVPLDPAYPAERLAYLVGDSGARVVVTRAALADRVPGTGAATLLVDADEAPAAPGVAGDVDPDNAAYVIYTSGSTGAPKGVMVSHRSLVCYAEAARAELGLGAEDRFLQFASPAFDVMVEEIFPAWLSGAAVVFPEHDLLESPEALLETVEAQGVTGFELPTAFWHEWVRMLAEEGRRLPASLRFVIVGGERVLPERLAQWAGLGVPLVHVFGLTETTVSSAMLHLAAGDDGSRWSNLPVGHPLANAALYVLDSGMQPVPEGAPGELYLGGDTVARGYHGRPVLTAERFVPDPFGAPGARLYRTGDRVRRLAEGGLEFLGRIDQQVKIRGFRIEPGEIEAALAEHPAVREAVVVAREEAAGRKQLLAYVVPAQGGVALPVAADELRAHLAGRLPDYMVPGLFVAIDRVPLTSNGKVDRRALPEPEAGPAAGSADYAPPAGEVERTLCAIWAEALRLDRVGVHDDYFELGGDSILAIQIVSRARRAGLWLKPRQLFLHPTVARLAREVGVAGAAAEQAEQGAVTGRVELTPIQRWFFEEEIPERHHWNMPLLLELRHPVDPDRLEAALRALAAHHDALRFRYSRAADGAWVQGCAAPDAPLPLERADLSAVPDEELAERIGRRSSEAQAALDLENGPLLRAVLLEPGNGRPQRLLLAAHHLVVDGVSWRVLLEDLQTALDQLGRGEAVALPPKTTSFQRWASRLAEHTARGGFDAELDYWLDEPRRMLRPLPVELPGGREENTVGASRTLSVSLSPEETRALLAEAPAAYRTQVGDLLLCALARAFAAWTGEARLLVELEGHGREELFEDVDLSRTVGWFTTVFPVLLDLRGAEGEGESLKRVKEQLREVPGRGIGYGALRRLSPDAATRARLAALPGAEVSFNHLGQADGSLPEEGLFRLAADPAGEGTGPRAPRQHLLSVDSIVLDGRLRVTWTFGGAAHRPETVEALAERHLAELRALVAHCVSAEAGGYTPSDFPLAGLSQAELDALLVGDRGVEDLYPLTSLQEGLLFHTLYAREEGLYLAQYAFELEGALDEEALRRAWDATLARHSALRSSFRWRDLARPLQVVHRQVRLPWAQEDWRALPAADRQAALDAYLRDDVARGFDLESAPLMRVALFRTGDDRYRMVWSLLQAVLDGWSLPLVFRDLRAFYQAFAEGRQPTLGAAPRHREYVAWTARQDPSRTEAFWRETLAGFDAPTPLPLEHAAAAGGPERREQATLRLPAPATDALRAFARAQGLTPGTVVQGAWAMLLARYAGEDDVVFGVTVSGRPAELPGVEEMVGVFINTLPVRVRLPGDARVDGWLRALQADAAAVREHEHVPLTQVQQWSAVPAGQELFGSIYVFENYPMDEALAGGIGGVAVRGMTSVERGSYPLALIVVPGPSLALRLLFDPARLEPAAAGRLLGHLGTVVEALAARPERLLSDVPLLGAAERAQVLETWNDTAAAYPRATLDELLAGQAARTPERVAVVFGEESLTYAELDRRAGRLARHLRARGVGPEVRVGVCAERSVELVVALLAVLRAGGAYVPVDPGHPAERIAYVLADSDVRVLLAQERFVDALPAHGAGLVVLDRDEEWSGDGSAEAPAAAAAPENAAYVIYTSGSTGRPKGAVNEHRGIVNRLLWMQERYGLGADDVVLQKTPFGFDVSVWEFFWPLMTGARLVVAEPGGHRDPVYLAELIERERVTTAHFVPPMLQAFLDGADAERCRSLRRVVCSGEALPAELTERFFAALPWAELHNLYGPTEAAVDVTHHACVRDPGRVVPIGRPVANTRIYVLDAALQPAPVGVPGELYIGGVQVGRGYLARPGLTAERFVPDPHGPAGGRLYRTGDRARWLASGEVEYLGRVDFQVKVRGFRIEPGEIEAALLAGPGVREALVMLREDAPGQAQLVAYVVPADGAEPSAPELRARLGEVLPEHMVPGAFVVLESFPLNPNGKVDRRALPGPERSEAPGRVAPQTATEEVLAGIWADVLGVEQVWADDNFFELGGHSLLVTGVVSRVRRALGVEVPLRALFDARTVSALARWIDDLQGDGSPAAPPVLPVPRDAPLPLSFAQQRLWVMDRLEPGSFAYNMPFALRLRGDLDVPALRASLGETVRRHEVLRTVFAEHRGVPVQVVLPAGPRPLPAVDLRALPGEEAEREALRLAREEAVRPFDLARGPLLRGALLRVGDRDHVLCVTLHHVVADGWSLDVLVGEVSALYAAFSRGEPSPLPELAVQYADYSVWQRSWLDGDVLDRQLAYWRERLAGAPPLLEFPTDRPRSVGQSARAGARSFALPAGTTRELRSLARREGATLFMTVLAAWQALLGRWSGQDDVVVGSPVAGRTRLETEGLIGMFVNLLALRAELAGEPTWRELLARVRRDALGAYAHQDLPFERLVDEIVTERSLTYFPVFQVVFALQRVRPDPLSLGGVAVQTFGGEAAGVRVDLELTLGEGEAGLSGELLFREALFDPATMERLMLHLGACLEAMAADPEGRFSELSLLRGAERVQVLETWNATASEPPRAPVHELFSRQAARTPDVPAAVFGACSLTYAELERRSNRVAHLLRRLGAGPEVRVGLCLERGVDLVVGVLGVLKSGGVYVPLDPTFPPERLAYMLADSGASLLLSHAAIPERLPGFAGEVVRLDADAAAIAAEPEGPVPARTDPAGAAYVIYTSGSTGTPKGVVVEHGSMANFVVAMQRLYDYREGEAVLGVGSFAFDVWIFETLVPLVCGATARILPSERVRDGAALVEELRTAGRMAAVPAIFRQAITAARQLEPGALAGVRYVFAGGEAVPPEMWAEMREAFPAARLFVGYGPTEATVLATMFEVPEGRHAGGPAIGRPLPNSRVYVLDARGDALPAGVPGELCLGGVQVARGYLGRPGLTAERFVPDAFGGEPGSRLYRTGDRARWRADGELEYLGRLDTQVKIRGFRIELGEVEAVLAGQPGVREALAMVREDVPGRPVLTAYLVRGEGEEVSTGELRERLAAVLPEYMVPGAYVVLDRFPLSAVGKVDRRALPAPSRGALQEGYVAPRTPLEELLAGIWEEVLGIEGVGVEESFFELGGDSILSIQAISRARQRGLALTPRQLFENPTIAGLARVVESAGAEPAAAARETDAASADFPLAGLDREALGSPAAGGGEVEDVYPLTPMQEGMLFHTLYAPGSGIYVRQSLFVLEGPLDDLALERAWQGAVARHEALRAGFAWEGVRRPVQLIHREARVPFGRTDWSGLDPADAPARLEAHLTEDRARGFDLAHAPLMRLELFRLGEEDHRLLWTNHHVITDGWSLSMIFRDVLALYAAYARGEETPRLEPAGRYRDYVAWLERQDRSRAESYWRAALAGFAAPTRLPLPKAGGQDGADGVAGSARADLPEAAMRPLRELAARRGLTMNTLVQGAWALLLSRYAGEDDVVFGAAVSGRPVELGGVERTVGLFINSLPVRVRVDSAATVGEWLADLQERQAQAREFDYAPLVEVTRWSEVPEGEALFETLVVFDNTPAARAAAEPVEGVRVRAVEGVAQTDYPVTLAAGAAGGTLSLDLRYDRGLVEADAAERLVGHLRAVLQAMAADADGRLSEVSLLSGAERGRVVEEWNATAADFPRACIHELIAEWTGRTPDAPAVVFGDETLTRAELQRRADRLAHRLRRLGVGPETRVGVCLERSAEMVAAVVAVLRAGGAYLPLDPAYPPERLRHMLADSGAAVVLTTTELAGAVSGYAGELVLLDAEREALAGEPDTPPESGVGPQNAAYVIYTSGSTGTPKGVVVPHLGLCNVARAQARDLGIAPGDRVLQFASASFDASVFEMVMGLACGGVLLVGTREELAPGPDLLRFLRDRGVNAATLAPAALAVLPHEELPELRVLMTAGEALPAEVADRWAPGRSLWNLYGPTEATIWSTAGLCRAGAGRPAIGRPVANTAAYVLDAGLTPLPPGVPGELFVGGAGVARGYLGRADLTAERFVPDPFGREPGARLYRTGDRVRWLPAGELEFLGRTDQQVKVRGFRIEPGEVEAVLEAHSGVREAVVLVREDAPGDRRLVAYVAPGRGADLDPAGLRAWLRERLPEHMVPSAVVVLETFPLTPNGKTDRRALPKPEAGGGGASPAAPRSPVEEMLSGICAEVLGLDEVAGGDSFFELGGHSLLAIQAVTRIHEVLGVEIPLQLLFEEPTVTGLAERIEALRAEGGAAPPAAIGRVPRGRPLPLSFAQQRLWLLDRLEPGSAAYNIPAALRLRGPLDEAALRGSLDVLVARHETLRTTFAESGGAPVQVVHPPAPVPLPTLDLRAHPAPEEEALRLAGEEALRPFDLARGPLLRSTLLRLGDEDSVLLFTLHHAVSDGWSTDVLVREVSEAYTALGRGEEPRLPELAVQYADYAVWQREHLSGAALEAQLAFWREQLRGAPPLLEIPTDRPRSAEADARAASHAFVLPAEASERLRALSRREGTTLFMTALAAWQMVLGRWAGQDDVVVGSPVAGRTRLETEALIGFFVNMLALRADLSDDPTWAGLLGRVREAALGAYDHQELPFERLVEELGVERSLAHSPVFQATFALDRSGAGRGLSLGGLAVERFGAGEGVAKFDLDLGLQETDAGLAGTLLYRTALFDPGTIARLAGHVELVLESLAEDPSRRIGDVPLLRGAERAQVLEAWNDTAAAYPRATLHELFVAQAARTPDAVAVVFEGESLSYAELARRSGLLAGHLRRCGVGPEARVGVCAERSPELVVALLATLEAGGAYVPVDPSHPAERIGYVLADSAVSVLLTQARHLERLPAHEARVVLLDGGPEWAAGGADGEAPAPAGDPAGLAYVIYTSGSTGRPKGAMNEHRGIVNRLLWMQDAYGLDASDVVLQKTPFSFDVSVWEFFWPLITGARLVLAPPEEHRDANAVAGLIERERVTTLHFVPPMLQAFLDAGGAGRCRSVRRVVCSGEALPYELAERFRAELPWAELHNLYGPTEAAVDVTFHAFAPDERRVVPIGRPVANTRVYVLDAGLDPSPVRVPGELYIGGVQVGRGYLGRPELTAERFVPDPFGEPGARLYRTGDRAAWREDGRVEYLGRVDFQVKVRGFRIEPGEIEAALRAHPAVREAVVLAREDVPGERRLVAYGVVEEGVETSVAELRAHLAALLPEHMVPAAYVVLPALPLNANGKLDRRALPAPDHAAETEYVAPRTVVEELLCSIWAELLGVERVGVHDNFFALGGHSLLATKMASRALESFGVDVPLRELFRMPTVAALAEAVEEQMLLGLDDEEVAEGLGRPGAVAEP